MSYLSINHSVIFNVYLKVYVNLVIIVIFYLIRSEYLVVKKVLKLHDVSGVIITYY